jgi:glycosyltransferase involved in cell wall biosynthesis
MVRALWASPLPPVRSGVSDYAIELLPELCQRLELRVLAPPGWTPPDDWPLADLVEMVPHTCPPEPDEILLAHLGNNPYHDWIADRLGTQPTVAVLHDVVLHHLLVEITLGHDRPEQYASRLQAALGAPARALINARRHGLTGRRDPFLFPAWQAFTSRTAACIVHSSRARQTLLDGGYRNPVHQMALAASDPGPQSREALRQELGVSPDTALMMHLGFLTPEKGMREVLTAVAVARETGVPVHLVLVGEGQGLASLEKLTGTLNLTGAVTTTGWVPVARLPQLPAAADLGVVLRRPSAGETSAAVLRFLACSTPVAVTGLHQLLEWPEAAAPRLTPGAATAPELSRLLGTVVQERRDGSWQKRRQAARHTYENGHRPEQAAKSLAQFLDDLSV